MSIHHYTVYTRTFEAHACIRYTLQANRNYEWKMENIIKFTTTIPYLHKIKLEHPEQQKHDYTIERDDAS